MRLPRLFDIYYEKQREYNLTHWQHDKAYFGLNASSSHWAHMSEALTRPSHRLRSGSVKVEYLWVQMHGLCPPPWGMEEHFELIMNYSWSGTVVGYTFEDKQTLMRTCRRLLLYLGRYPIMRDIPDDVALRIFLVRVPTVRITSTNELSMDQIGL